MATEETAVNGQEERLSEELQAELDDDMFFGEEDAPEENLAGDDDFLSTDDLLDSADDLLGDETTGNDEFAESGPEEEEQTEEPGLKLSDLAPAETGPEALDELPPLDESESPGRAAEPDSETLQAEPLTEAEETAEDADEMEELPPLEEGDLSGAEDSQPVDESESVSLTSTEEEAAVTEEPSEPPEEPEQAIVDESPVAEEAPAAIEEAETALALDEGDADEANGISEAKTASQVTDIAQDMEPTEKVMDNETLPPSTASAAGGAEMLLNFHHEVRVEVARTRLSGEEITQITNGSIIELDKVAGEPVDLVLDGKTIAQGEVVLINNEKLGIRIIGIVQE